MFEVQRISGPYLMVGRVFKVLTFDSKIIPVYLDC
jgi:hypothetical protein